MAQRSQSKAKGWQQPVLLLLRLLIVGAALGVITGTALKWLAPQLNADVPLPTTDTPEEQTPSLGSFSPKQENKALSRRLAEIAATQKDLKHGLHLRPLRPQHRRTRVLTALRPLKVGVRRMRLDRRLKLALHQTGGHEKARRLVRRPGFFPGTCRSRCRVTGV